MIGAQTRLRRGKYPVETVLTILREKAANSQIKPNLFEFTTTTGRTVIVNRHLGPKNLSYLYSGTKCVRCGLEGQYFALERQRTSDSDSNDISKELQGHATLGKPDRKLIYHFNLYGIDEQGVERLLNPDHIVPRCLGGTNEISNLQTMCAPCNSVEKSREDNELVTLHRNNRLAEIG